MTITEALDSIGVHEELLTDQERNHLDEQGYVVLRTVLSPDQVEAFRQRQAEILSAEGETAGKEVHQEAGTDRLSDLINKDPLYHIVLTQPRVLAAVAHVLKGDLKLSSLNSRSALPGQGLQALHADWGRLETPGEYQVCNSLWLLDDFTPDNGATRVVPGTHLGTALPGDEMTDPSAAHPKEIILQAHVGDVVVVNSHLWHGGTRNQTDKPRRVMHGYFSRRHQPQQLDQQKFLRPETYAQLTEPARTVLGVHAPA